MNLREDPGDADEAEDLTLRNEAAKVQFRIDPSLVSKHSSWQSAAGHSPAVRSLTHF